MPPVEISPASSGSSASTPVNVKLLLIGNASVGKSSLLLRFSDEAWIPEDEATATIGVDFRVSTYLQAGWVERNSGYKAYFVERVTEHVVPQASYFSLTFMTPWKSSQTGY